MHSFYENIYLKAPVLLQNIALSLYGYRLKKIRYGGNYNSFFNQVCSQYKWDSEKLNEHINTLLLTVIKHAGETVPYYSHLFHKLGIGYKDIRSIEDLKIIPILDKNMVKSRPQDFVSKSYKSKQLIRVHTTGTTGTPLTIYCNRMARQWNYAFYDRFLDEAEINFRGRRATFGGRLIIPHEQTTPPFWRYSYFQKNMLFSSYHLKDQNVIHYINKLKEYKPDLIDSYPSSLYTIARCAKKYNIPIGNYIKRITTSAETLSDEHRDVIESQFNTPVIDQYGAAEMCIFVGQCKLGNYHIHSDYAVVEFLKKDGTPAEPGEEAEIVCTGLINPVMPLIRYRIGDRGILSEKICNCGSPFPVMEKILGRIDDVIKTPDGRLIGRLSPVLKGYPVKEAQYIQKTIDALTFLIVTDTGYSEETEKSLEHELRKRIGKDIDITFQYVEFIKREKGGKHRTVISKLKP